MNLPNRISLGRIILVPIIVLVYLFPYEDFHIIMGGISFYEGMILRWSDVIVLLLFIVAALSDFVDGYIARKYHLITSFGKFIDPIADKLLVNTMLVLFAVRGEVSVIPVLLMIWRDMLVDGIRMQASSKGKVIAAGFAGKLKTVLQMASVIVLLLHNFPFGYVNLPVDQILLWAATIASLYSGWVYFYRSRNILLETM